VTDLDDNPNGQSAQAVVRELLGDTDQCPPGSLLLNFVGVAQVLLPNGATRIVRGYPWGPVCGTMERGMLTEALSDSWHDRETKRRPA
jgi:hypothetical protein